jgi:hypothetical protein
MGSPGRERGAVTTAVVTRTPLSASDRCDRCGAQAYVRVRLITGELHFCAHHAKQFEPNLKKIAVEIVDETDRLDSPIITPRADV